MLKEYEKSDFNKENIKKRLENSKTLKKAHKIYKKIENDEILNQIMKSPREKRNETIENLLKKQNLVDLSKKQKILRKLKFFSNSD